MQLRVPGKAAYHTLPAAQQNRIRMKSLLAVSAALQAAGCAHHVKEATLLGLVRDRALIPHDSDDDIAAYGCTGKLHAVMAKLAPQGFRLCRRDGPLWSICREGAYIDVELWRVAGGGVCSYGEAWESLPCAFVFPIQGLRPFAPEKVLELLYGATWRVPSSKHAGDMSASKIKRLAAKIAGYSKPPQSR